MVCSAKWLHKKPKQFFPVIIVRNELRKKVTIAKQFHLNCLCCLHFQGEDTLKFEHYDPPRQ
jgi:hypothetical protein